MAKEVSGVALVVAQEVPTSSTMAVPHGPAGVGSARRRMRAELRACGTAEGLVDDAVLVLSELLSNACRHARPLSRGMTEEYVRAAWSCAAGGGEVTIAVTDGGAPTRPRPAKPSVTARGGRGLAIITSLAREWGVGEHMTGSAAGGRLGGRFPRGAPAGGVRAGVTVWAVLAVGGGGFGGALGGLGVERLDVGGQLDVEGLDGLDELDAC